MKWDFRQGNIKFSGSLLRNAIILKIIVLQTNANKEIDVELLNSVAARVILDFLEFETNTKVTNYTHNNMMKCWLRF